jgi:23S rRNA (pseudouridine1915-N3)-methyltransferase
MLDITIICVGGLKESFWKDACAEYIKRLSQWAKVTVIEIPQKRLPAAPSKAETDAALRAEETEIAKKIPRGAFVTALCIEGREYSSEQFADIIASRMQTSGSFTFIIGGSRGLSQGAKDLSALKLSFSRMTFPHMTARVLLLEQLYRALSILSGGKYHK